MMAASLPALALNVSGPTLFDGVFWPIFVVLTLLVRRFCQPAFWAMTALGLLLLFNRLLTPGFFDVTMKDGHFFGSLIDVLNRGAPVMLLSLGMTLVIATFGVDLSVGAVMAIAGATAACLISRPSDSPLSAINVHGSIAAVIAISLAIALVAGIWNGLLVAFLDIQPIVATLILMVAGRGIAQLLTNGQIPTFQNPGFEFLGSGFFLALPFPVTIVAVMFIVTALLTRGTAIGLFIESVGNNPTASRYSGVNARMVKVIVYAFTGLCAGIAGLIATADIKAADVNNIGLYLELDAILAVCIGGTSMNGGRFSLIGTIIGAILMQALTTTILMTGVPKDATLMIKAGVVIVVCLMQSGKFRASFAGLTRRRAA